MAEDQVAVKLTSWGYARRLCHQYIVVSKEVFVLVNYAGSKPINVKTPIMKCLYGVDQPQGKCIMKLDLSDPSMSTVKTVLENIDDKLLELPDEANWFENPEDAFYYTPHFKDYIRVQFPMKFGRINGVEIVQEGNDLATIGDITAGSLVQCELEWKNIWIIDKTFGYFWSIKKIEIINK